jgi:flagellar hook-associated protein 1 FlgK
MYGPNVGLEIGKRALLAQQLALNLTGHNIANVNTPGFTRQQAIMTSNLPLTMPFGIVGTGVDVSEIRRVRSLFIDQQMRGETQKLGKWSFLNQTWSQIESIFSEPEDTGLSAVMDQFWSSWQDLANNPQSEAARVTVREQASILVNSFHHLSTQLSDLRDSLDESIAKMVTQINSLASQITDLNQSISTAELTGNTANDLRDRRDFLVDQLSQLVDVSVLEQPTGAITVYIGSMALVESASNLELATAVESDGSKVLHRVFFKGTGVDLEHPGGEFEGLLETRDTVVVDRQKELNVLASELAKAVNETHRQGSGAQGSTGIDFFNPETTGAADIELNTLITQNINYIAAGRNGEAGDNSNALEMAALRNKLLLKEGHATFSGYYDAVVGEIGVRTKEADSLDKNQQALISQLQNSKQSLEGVSLDEEMANMIEYEHAYAAAARVITYMDSALDTVINGMGLVGR